MPAKRTEVDPKDTLKLLDQMEALGFNDDAFWLLHHFRERKHETIGSFRRYCSDHQAFQKNGNNQLVHERLKFVSTCYQELNLSPGQTQDFVKLAEEAFLVIPKK